MSGSDSTRWSLIRKAAQGLAPDREDFARVYEPVARAYLYDRWRRSPLLCDVDDAVQEVFIDCFKSGGALARADASRPGGFRAFYYGILRNTALVFERKRARRRDAPGATDTALDGVPAGEPGLSTAFDRAWAEAILREAADRHRELAEEKGSAAVRRYELLKRRFTDGDAIRDIAADWGVEAADLSEQLRVAKGEFEEALFEVVAYHCADPEADVEAEALRIIGALR